MRIIDRTAIYLRIAAALLCMALGAEVSAATVPFRGALQGFYTSPPGVDPTTISASGSASHLGRFTFGLVGHVTPDAISAFGTMEFVAANGDKLFAEFTGVATLIAPPFLLIEENVQVTGGTGRFAGVTGTLLMRRAVDMNTGFTTGEFAGKLVK